MLLYPPRGCWSKEDRRLFWQDTVLLFASIKGGVILIEFNDVSVTYNATGVDALNKIDLKIKDGEFVFVVGESGAGKSTLIKLLQKEVDATEGQVIVNGFDLNKMRRRKIPYLRRTIGVVFQDYRLIPNMTVYENVAFVMRCVDAPKKYIKTRVPYVIGLVGLTDKADSLPEQLSGGEQQRVAIARALANDPRIIIADEPTANVDPALTYAIFGLLRSINECGTTVIVVTHDLDNVVRFGGRIIRLDKGNVALDKVFEGDETFNQPNS